MSPQARERGATLLEWVLVLPLLFVVALAPLFISGILEAKRRAQMSARNAAMASNGRMPSQGAAPASALASSDESHFEVSSTPSISLEQRAFPIANVHARQWARIGLGARGLVGARADVAISPNARAEASASHGGPWSLFGHLLAAPAQASVWLMADSGQLNEGGDADVERMAHATGRALGGREHGLTSRVRALAYGGEPNALATFERRISLLPWVGALGLPSLQGVFVVARAYRHEGPAAQGCQGIPSYRTAAGSESGLRDLLDSSGAPLLDHGVPRCFDTAPMRDAHGYPSQGRPGNASLRLFRDMGVQFLGCSNPESDDPFASGRAWYELGNGSGASCEGP